MSNSMYMVTGNGPSFAVVILENGLPLSLGWMDEPEALGVY